MSVLVPFIPLLSNPVLVVPSNLYVCDPSPPINHGRRSGVAWREEEREEGMRTELALTAKD